jgi:hypothetical protein
MIEVFIVSEETIEDHAKCTKQLVETVVMNVKYHLSLVMINQFTVLIVSKIINQNEVIVVEEDLVEEVQVDMEEMIEVVLDSEETIEDHAKCTKQLVETVVMNVKYHLSLVMIDQFTVLIVSEIIDKTS